MGPTFQELNVAMVIKEFNILMLKSPLNQERCKILLWPDWLKWLYKILYLGSFASYRCWLILLRNAWRFFLRDTPDLSYVQPEGNHYFKTSDSYEILNYCSINISDCLKSPDTCESSPCITTCKIKYDKFYAVNDIFSRTVQRVKRFGVVSFSS
jgi:hypothetical protein